MPEKTDPRVLPFYSSSGHRAMNDLSIGKRRIDGDVSFRRRLIQKTKSDWNRKQRRNCTADENRTEPRRSAKPPKRRTSEPEREIEKGVISSHREAAAFRRCAPDRLKPEAWKDQGKAGAANSCSYHGYAC